MSAGHGPKVFALPGSELVKMMQANFKSLETVVDDVDKAIAEERVALEQAIAAEKEAKDQAFESEDAAASVNQKRNMVAHLERWREKFAEDAIATQILLSHVRPKDVHMMTGTEMIGVFRTFRTVHVHIPYLRLNPPPSSGELAEHRLAATAAAIPRATGNAMGISHNWAPSTPGAELAVRP